MKLIFRNDITPFEYCRQHEQLGEVWCGFDLIGYNPAVAEVFQFEVSFSYDFQNYRWRKTSGSGKEDSFSEWPKSVAEAFQFEVSFSYDFQNYRWRKTSGPEREASFSEWPKTYWWATRFDFKE